MSNGKLTSDGAKLCHQYCNLESIKFKHVHRSLTITGRCRDVIIGTFRLDYEYEIEYEYEFSILVFRLHIMTTHTHFIP